MCKKIRRYKYVPNLSTQDYNNSMGKDAYFEWEYFENGYFVSGRTSKTAAKSISNLVDGYFEFNFENGSFEN